MLSSSQIKTLNKINQDFYNTTAKDFDESRQYFWQGWNNLITCLEHFNKLKLLDLGCGNSRFYQFIKENFSKKNIEYLGIDNNKKLLELAQKKFSNDHNFKLQNSDLILSLLTKKDFILNNDFNIITSFGVFHHIPSFKLRLNLLNYLKSKIQDDGLIIISLWQFMNYPRFTKKICNPIELKKIKLDTIKLSTLENNDYILDWRRGERSLRYCHFIDDNEQTELIKQSNLRLIKKFKADGKERDVNTYLVLKKM